MLQRLLSGRRPDEVKRLLLIFALILLLALTACGAKKIVHCDSCGREIEIDADSDMTEDWIILCSECKKALGE